MLVPRFAKEHGGRARFDRGGMKVKAKTNTHKFNIRKYVYKGVRSEGTGVGRWLISGLRGRIVVEWGRIGSTRAREGMIRALLHSVEYGALLYIV